jgi:hypothetical protein
MFNARHAHRPTRIWGRVSACNAAEATGQSQLENLRSLGFPLGYSLALNE